MNLLHNSHSGKCKADELATSEDFCKLFTEDMTRLYLLSFVLTASHAKAEQCFVAGLEDCVNGNPPFKDWARSWAERTIFKNAIRIMAPHPTHASGTFAQVHPEEDGRHHWPVCDQPAAIASVLALGDFDRFVFVMSVLEGYTEKECSVLLVCSQQDVHEARMRAPQQIAEYMKHDGAGQGDSIESSSRSPEMLVH